MRRDFIEPFQVCDTIVTGIAHITPALDGAYRVTFYSALPCPGGDCVERVICAKIVATPQTLREITSLLIGSNACWMRGIDLGVGH